MARNIELLKRVRDFVRNDPSRVDMGLWAYVPYDVVELDDGGVAKVECGTTACIAGWTVQLSGDRLLCRGEDLKSYDYRRHTAVKHFSVGFCVAKNGRVMDIEERARKLLGLTFGEKEALFYEETAEGALKILDALIAGEKITADID